MIKAFLFFIGKDKKELLEIIDSESTTTLAMETIIGIANQAKSQVNFSGKFPEPQVKCPGITGVANQAKPQVFLSGKFMLLS